MIFECARQRRDNYQRALNSPLTPGWINFAAAVPVARTSTGLIEPDSTELNQTLSVSSYLSLIFGQTLRVCPEGKPVSTFPDHALASRPILRLSRDRPDPNQRARQSRSFAGGDDIHDRQRGLSNLS
jgi:hypothetical protein